MTATTQADKFGNRHVKHGCHRCWCGCKYWEHDTCIGCGEKFDANDYDADGERIVDEFQYLKDDKARIGTYEYEGHAYFWAHEYRHYLRDLGGCPPGVTENRYGNLLRQLRVDVHRDLLRLGLPLVGESDDHHTVIRYHRLQALARLDIDKARTDSPHRKEAPNG